MQHLGSNQTKGTRLCFAVAPNSGYGVAKWIINGTDYADAKNLPEGMRISEDGKILDVASLNWHHRPHQQPGHTKDKRSLKQQGVGASRAPSRIITM